MTTALQKRTNELTKLAPKTTKKPAPDGLKKAGKRLWKRIIDDLGDGWALDERELALLEQAARCEDDMAALNSAVDRDGAVVRGSRGQPVAHPALSEVRQLRLVQLRLLSALELVDPALSERSATPAQARARRAANSRWGNDR